MDPAALLTMSRARVEKTDRALRTLYSICTLLTTSILEEYYDGYDKGYKDIWKNSRNPVDRKCAQPKYGE